MTQAAREIEAIVETLDESDQRILLEVARRFAPDDWATADDISNHERSMDEFKRGECVRMTLEDWGIS